MDKTDMLTKWIYTVPHCLCVSLPQFHIASVYSGAFMQAFL